MSSIHASISQPIRQNAKFMNIRTMSYSNGTVGDSVAVPLSVVNGVLDIVIENSDVQDFITNGTGPDDAGDTEYQAHVMGGSRLVSSLGPNFRTWLTNYINVVFSTVAGTPAIVVNPTMQRVQYAVGASGLGFEQTFGTSENPPSGSLYVTGSPQSGDATSYFSTWVFQSPMTIAVPESSSSTGTRYLTFTTNFDGN